MVKYMKNDDEKRDITGIDEVDKKILDLFNEDGRMSYRRFPEG